MDFSDQVRKLEGGGGGGTCIYEGVLENYIFWSEIGLKKKKKKSAAQW